MSLGYSRGRFVSDAVPEARTHRSERSALEITG